MTPAGIRSRTLNSRRTPGLSARPQQQRVKPRAVQSIVGVGIEDNDGIPFGQVAEDSNDEDEPMEEADGPPLSADLRDDEAGPAAPYEPESESDDDEEDGVGPTAKRAHWSRTDGKEST